MTTATTTATKISVSHLYKRYGSHQVIDDVSFDVQEGQVTLLAGPNGAGKSTLLRMICGLDTIDKGDITIMGQRYAQLSDPKHTIGALLDATWLDTALTAEQNLRVLADLAGIHRRRVANCLEMCGLTSVASRKVSDFSLGMRQRCGIAAALLGDPDLLILDEPVNGLDPAGMRWLNDLFGIPHSGRGDHAAFQPFSCRLRTDCLPGSHFGQGQNPVGRVARRTHRRRPAYCVCFLRQ